MISRSVCVKYFLSIYNGGLSVEIYNMEESMSLNALFDIQGFADTPFGILCHHNDFNFIQEFEDQFEVTLLNASEVLHAMMRYLSVHGPFDVVNYIVMPLDCGNDSMQFCNDYVLGKNPQCVVADVSNLKQSIHELDVAQTRTLLKQLSDRYKNGVIELTSNVSQM